MDFTDPSPVIVDVSQLSGESESKNWTLSSVPSYDLTSKVISRESPLAIWLLPATTESTVAVKSADHLKSQLSQADR